MSSKSATFTEQKRREQILECAIEHLAQGYAEASMHGIARSLGISTGVISYHFGNKAGLMTAARERVVATALEIMIPAITATTTARQGLRALVVSNLEFMAEHPVRLRALVELIRHDIVTAGLDAQVPQGVADVEQLLRWGQDQGEFRDFVVRPMAVTIRAAIDQVPMVLEYEPDLDIAAYGEQLAELFDRATRTEVAA